MRAKNQYSDFACCLGVPQESLDFTSTQAGLFFGSRTTPACRGVSPLPIN